MTDMLFYFKNSCLSLISTPIVGLRLKAEVELHALLTQPASGPNRHTFKETQFWLNFATRIQGRRRRSGRKGKVVNNHESQSLSCFFTPFRGPPICETRRAGPTSASQAENWVCPTDGERDGGKRLSGTTHMVKKHPEKIKTLSRSAGDRLTISSQRCLWVSPGLLYYCAQNTANTLQYAKFWEISDTQK